MKFRKKNPNTLIIFFIIYAFIMERVTDFLIKNTSLFISIPVAIVVASYLFYIVISGFNYIEIDAGVVKVKDFFKTYKSSLADVSVVEKDNKFIVELKEGKKIIYRKGIFGIFTKGGNSIDKFRNAYKK